MKHQFIWRDGMRKMYRKFVVASVSASVVSSMVVPNGINVHAEQEAFSDVSKDAFYYEAVQNLAARGIINGFQDGTFRPNERVTRGQAAVMLASALNLNTQNVNNPGFKDVPTNSWYYHSIAALVNAGIITGFSDKTFKPNESLTRAQVAAIISLGFQLTENKQAATTFKDISNTDWYAGFVGALVENGIAKGISQTSFGPNNFVTRGQLATFIYRSEGKINTKSVIESVTNTDVVINGKTYQLSEQVKPILNESNKAALNHALISFESSDSTITKIKYLEITASGQSEMSGHVVLDGKNGAINGDVKISSDFVTVQNLTVEGNFEIGEELQNSFYSNKLVVLGKTLISKQTTSLAKANSNYAAAEKKKIKIIFENSTLRIVEVSKNDTSIEVTGETTLLELIVTSNASIEASDGLVIPKITLQIGAEFFEIHASVTELTVDSMDAITLTGNANIENVIVNTGAEVNLDIKGEIKKIEVTNKDAQLIVGKETKIKDICLPEGSKIEEIIKNYDEVKANIENINGEKNPDAKPSHSTDGGGGAPADHTAPTAVTNVAGTSDDVNPDAVGGVQNVITWDENTASDLDHYEVYRSEANEVALPKIIFVDAGTENYTDTEVIPGTTYTYTVFAVDRNGNKSAVSNAVSVETTIDQFLATNPQLRDVIVNGVTFTPEMYENIFITAGELNAINSFVVRATEVAADIDVTVTTTLENNTVVHEILAKQQNTSEVELDIASMKAKYGVLPAGVYHFTIKLTNNKGEVESIEIALDATKKEREYIPLNGMGHPNGEQDQLFKSVRAGSLEIIMPEITAANGFKIKGKYLVQNKGDFQYQGDTAYVSATIPKTEIPSDYTIKYYTVNDVKYDGAPNDYGTANYFFLSKAAEFIGDDRNNSTLEDWVQVPEYTKDIKIYATNAKGEEKVYTLTVHYIPTADLSVKATMENFNTHANMDYLGVNVGWNFSDLDFSKVKELRVNLYDQDGEIIATNTGNLEKLAELYESGVTQFSTPFIVVEFAYRQSEDEYWTFGEVDWSGVNGLTKAELVLVGLDDTEYKFVNPNLVEPEGTLEEILLYYPLGLVFGADSVEGMRAALETADLGLNRDMYDDLTDEGKQSVAKIMYFFMDIVKDFFDELMEEVEISSMKVSEEEDELDFIEEFFIIQYFFDIAVNFEGNKLRLVELFADETVTSEDLSAILHSFLWGDEEYPSFLAMILSEDSDLDLTPYIEKHFEKEYFEELYDYLVAYENLTDEERIEVFNTVKGKPISNSFDTVIEYIYEAIDDILENEPLYIEKAFTYDLNDDGELDSYLIQTNRAIDDSSILEEYFTVDGVQIDSIDTGGSGNDNYFWLDFNNSGLGTDQLPQLSVKAGAFKDLNGISSSELTVGENVEEDSAAPFITSLTTENSTDSSVDVQILTEEGGTAYYVVLPAEAAAPDSDQVKDGGIGQQITANKLETINITGLTASTNYKVYVVVEDEMGNLSEVEDAEFSTSEQLEEHAVLEEIVALPVSPAPEAESPAPESGDPAPEDENPASEDEDLAPEDENPAPEDEDPAPEDENPASEDENPASEDENSAPEDENPAPEDENSTLPDATIGEELNDDTALEIGEGEDNSEESENPIDLIIVDETEENEEPISYSATLSEDKQTITINPNN